MTIDEDDSFVGTTARVVRKLWKEIGGHVDPDHGEVTGVQLPDIGAAGRGSGGKALGVRVLANTASEVQWTPLGLDIPPMEECLSSVPVPRACGQTLVVHSSVDN